MSLDTEPELETEPDEIDDADEHFEKPVDPRLLRSDRPSDYLGYPEFDNDDDSLTFSSNETAEMKVDAKTAPTTSQRSSANGPSSVQESSGLKMPAKKIHVSSSSKKTSSNAASSSNSRRGSKSRHSSRSLKVPTSGDAAGQLLYTLSTKFVDLSFIHQ